MYFGVNGYVTRTVEGGNKVLLARHIFEASEAFFTSYLFFLERETRSRRQITISSVLRELHIHVDLEETTEEEQGNECAHELNWNNQRRVELNCSEPREQHYGQCYEES